MLNHLLEQEVSELSERVFPHRDELPSVVADQLRGFATPEDSVLRHVRHPFGGGGSACHRSECIAGVIVDENADVHLAPIGEGGMLDVNVPLHVRTPFLVALIGNAV